MLIFGWGKAENASCIVSDAQVTYRLALLALSPFGTIYVRVGGADRCSLGFRRDALSVGEQRPAPRIATHAQ